MLVNVNKSADRISRPETHPEPETGEWAPGNGKDRREAVLRPKRSDVQLVQADLWFLVPLPDFFILLYPPSPVMLSNVMEDLKGSSAQAEGVFNKRANAVAHMMKRLSVNELKAEHYALKHDYEEFMQASFAYCAAMEGSPDISHDIGGEKARLDDRTSRFFDIDYKIKELLWDKHVSTQFYSHGDNVRRFMEGIEQQCGEGGALSYEEYALLRDQLDSKLTCLEEYGQTWGPFVHDDNVVDMERCCMEYRERKDVTLRALAKKIEADASGLWESDTEWGGRLRVV